MPVLFADHLQPKLNVIDWQYLEQLTFNRDNLPAAWPAGFGFGQVRRMAQLDKYEPALTYYLFAALNLATNNFHGNQMLDLLARAYPAEGIAQQVANHLAACGWNQLTFEAMSRPSAPMVQGVQADIHAHSIRYVRDFAAANNLVAFEGETVFDVFVGDPVTACRGQGDTGLGIEVKFTSDISCDTTYSPHRNQIIRNIEVGNSHFANFCFLLVSPKQFRNHSSRFYHYKMEEYMGAAGPAALDRDSLTQPGEEMAGNWQKESGGSTLSRSSRLSSRTVTLRTRIGTTTRRHLLVSCNRAGSGLGTDSQRTGRPYLES